MTETKLPSKQEEQDLKGFSDLNKRQQAFVRRYAQAVVDPKDNISNTQVAIDSGYSENSAGVIASQNLQKPHIAKAISRYLEASGLSLQEVTKKLDKAIKKGLDSDRVTVSDGLRGLDMALKLHDAYPVERKQIDKRSVSVNVEGKDLEEIKEGLKSLLNRAERVKKIRGESKSEPGE